MPSIRKRIGYLPSVYIQEIITNISNKENLSQSKVVGILVEEALKARGQFKIQNKNALAIKSMYSNEIHINNSFVNDSDLDEMISDKGITYNSKKYNHKSDYLLSESEEAYNEELFEQFKKFILFKKMIEEK
tara:strand:- start:226 stop:621 length:396 start_codon:yes stop_codon:yes gene_type:complete